MAQPDSTMPLSPYNLHTLPSTHHIPPPCLCISRSLRSILSFCSVPTKDAGQHVQCNNEAKSDAKVRIQMVALTS